MEEQATDFIFGLIIGAFAWFFGGIDGFLSVLITCIVVDWIIGTLDQYVNGKFNAKEFWPVWARKIGELCYVGIAHLFDKYMVGGTATFRTAVTLFYIVVEFKSIIEHSTRLDLPVPNFVQSRLLEIEKELNHDEKITRGESIQKAIDSNVFKEQSKPKHDDNKSEIGSIYEHLFEE